MSESRRSVLAVEQLRVETARGEEIVDAISFDVFAGEVLALVGESGCGKTSTALALLGHARSGTRIAGGSILLDGVDLLALDPRTLRKVRGSRISYVPQDPTAGLNPRQRIGNQIAEALLVHGRGGTEAREAVLDLAAEVRLPAEPSFLRRYPFELSGGQQQRVAIAMALACKPLVVVLDEPTTGLDVTTQARILDLLRVLGRETGTAFVYVTHDLAVVDNLADRVAVLYAGRVVEAGTLNHVFERPAHPYTTMLLASVPRLLARQELTGIAGSAPSPSERPAGCFFEPRCPIAIHHCREEFPNETAVAPGHLVRCWRAAELQAGTLGAAAPTERGGSDPLLAASQITAAYETRGLGRHVVLRGVSFTIAQSECLAVVGESGSGKTTLGRCIAGLHRPDSGSVVLKGTPLAASVAQRSRSERRAIQIVYQNPDRSLNPSETVGNAITRPLRIFGDVRRAAARREVVDLLERVRLPATYINRYPRELSGGEKQRVAVARALAARPSLLICDEITSALDVSIQAAIVSLLGELRSEDLALLFITHNLALVNSIANRVLVLEAGEAREYGETAAVMRRPSHAYTQQLLGAAPDLRVAPQAEESPGGHLSDR